MLSTLGFSANASADSSTAYGDTSKKLLMKREVIGQFSNHGKVPHPATTPEKAHHDPQQRNLHQRKQQDDS
jgi:hypothetical protein